MSTHHERTVAKVREIHRDAEERYFDTIHRFTELTDDTTPTSRTLAAVNGEALGIAKVLSMLTGEPVVLLRSAVMAERVAADGDPWKSRADG